MDPPGKAAASEAAKPPPRSPAGKPTTLLDVHEVEWITRELNRLLVRESAGRDAGAEDGHRHRHRRRHRHHHHHHHRHGRRWAKQAGPAPKPHADGKKGFGLLAELLGRHAVSICSDDAVAAGAAAGVVGRRGAGTFREVEKV